MATPPPPGPERDRRLAQRPRQRPRYAETVGDVLDSVLDREAMARMRRFGRVAGALKAVLPANALAKVRPVDLRAGVLTLEVDDSPLLAELRQHRAHALQVELAAAGTGVSRVAWRLARRR